MGNNSFYDLDPQTYDDQFWWKKDDIEFWTSTLSSTKNSILELGAGTGRIALPLLREGLLYKGLELSAKFCLHANQKLQHTVNKETIFQGDMRCFNFNEKFDNIIIPFNTLAHLLTEKDLVKTLQCIKKHMKKKSLLYIDIFVPHTLFLSRSKDESMQVTEFYNSKLKKESIINETIEYNSQKEIVHVKWQYKTDKIQYHKFYFDMKMYYPDSMNRILIDQGFDIVDLWGCYNKSKFNEFSTLQIYKCQKV